jgi:hypothetical protein
MATRGQVGPERTQIQGGLRVEARQPDRWSRPRPGGKARGGPRSSPPRGFDAQAAAPGAAAMLQPDGGEPRMGPGAVAVYAAVALYNLVRIRNLEAAT